MQQGAVLFAITKERDQASINDVTRILPLILKHRVDSDTLIRVINDVEGKGGKESIFSSGNKKISNKPEPTEETDYFKKTGRSLKDLNRKELINTEKSLDFNKD